MKYSNYKKGSSALRRMINDDTLDFCRQFARFNIRVGSSSRGYLRGIWNAKTKNITAFVNRKGVVFMRPGSVYLPQLEGSGTHVVVKNDKLSNYRNQVNNSTRRYSQSYLMAENALDRLIDNDDESKKVYLGFIKDDVEWNKEFFVSSLKELARIFELPNTQYVMKHNGFKYERGNDGTKIYLRVEDVADAIAREERLERIKREVAEAWIDHVREIAENAIVSGRTMNPLQFTYSDDGEDVSGTMNFNQYNLLHPVDVSMREWVDVESLMRTIRFSDRLYSLEERGIDEGARERAMQEEVQRRMTLTYADMSRRFMENMSIPVPSYVTSAVWDEPQDVVHIPSIDMANSVAVERELAEEATMAREMFMDEMSDISEEEADSIRENNYASDELDPWTASVWERGSTGSDFDPTTSG